MMTRSKMKRIAVEDSDKKYSTIPHDDVDPKTFNPVLWETLPREMLVLILARLPMSDIIRLKGLSREWRRDMNTVNSDINQAFDEACPNMIAIHSSMVLMIEGLRHFEFKVTICDLRTLNTHSMQYSQLVHPIGIERIDKRARDMCAHGGGLTCFVSAWRPSKTDPLCISVKNILTQLEHKLPPLLYNYLTPPQMMHIEVDSKTKYYKVVVISQNIEGRSTVEIYDSSAGQWTKATPPLGFIFGVAYKWHYDDVLMAFKVTSQTQCVYDFVEGQLKKCDEKGPSERALLMFIWKDCKFVLHRNTSSDEIIAKEGYSITKYCSQNNAKEWVKERTYLCSPFKHHLERDLILKWALKACKDFVMMFPHSSYSCRPSRRHFWI